MKTGVDETQDSVGNGGAMGVLKVSKASPRQRVPDIVLRLTAIALTLVAAIIMGVAKQTKTVYVEIVATLPPLPITATAKSKNSSAFVFFTVVNVIACLYSALSLVISIANRGKKRNMALLIGALDVVVMGLLFSGVGAASAIGDVGVRGNSHVGWNKVCDKYTKFCTNVLSSVVLSLIGSVVYLVLVLCTLVNLHMGSP